MAYICQELSPATVGALLDSVEAAMIAMGWLKTDEYVAFTAGKNPSPVVGDELEGNTGIGGVFAKANITDIVVTSGAFATNNAAGFFGLTNLTGQFGNETVKNNTHALNPAATFTVGTSYYNVVYSSAGELGTEIRQYVLIGMRPLATVNLTVFCYGAWDVATHTGTMRNIGSMAIVIGATKYVVAGDMDLVLIRPVSSANGDMLFGHIPKRFHPTPLATLTAPCIAGNGIALAVDNTVNFAINQTYWLFGAAGDGRWRANVTGIGVNTITVDNLGGGLAAGAKIGAAPALFGYLENNQFYSTWDRSTTGTGATAGLFWTMSSPYPITGLDPDQGLGFAGVPYSTPGMYVLTPITFGSALLYPAGISDSNFMMTPVPTAENTFGITASGGPIDTGTTSVGGNFTLQCLGKLWGVNAHANKIVIIALGTGLGQTRQIASNTADTLTVATQWVTNPNATSVFFIVDSAYRVPSTFTTIAYKEVI